MENQTVIQKQNKPIKQGGIYSLALGKNNGPFLPKDIMYNNSKSIQLLVGTQIVKSHISLAKSLEQFDARKKKQEESLKDSFLKQQKGRGLAQNIVDYEKYLNNQIVCLKKGGSELGVEIKRFRQQLQQLQKKVNYSNSNNMTQFVPCLKQLYNTIKKSFNDQKDKIYWLTRELDDVSSAGYRLGKQMKQCEDRLSEIQTTIGIKTEPFDELVVNEQLDEQDIELEE